MFLSFSTTISLGCYWIFYSIFMNLVFFFCCVLFLMPYCKALWAAFYVRKVLYKQSYYYYYYYMSEVNEAPLNRAPLSIWTSVDAGRAVNRFKYLIAWLSLILLSTWEWTNMLALCKCMYIFIIGNQLTTQNNDNIVQKPSQVLHLA